MNTGTRSLAILAAVLACCLLLAGCVTIPGSPPEQPATSQQTPAQPATAQQTTPPPGTAGTGPDNETAVVEANNQFALDLFDQLRQSPEYRDNNIFFSPFSISAALAITSEGARGQTASQIRSVLHFPDDPTALEDGYSRVLAGFQGEPSASTLRAANALWAEQTYPLLPEYIESAALYFDAHTTNLDFINRPEESRVTINRWVEDQTDEKIRDLLPAGSIDPSTRLVITNAIYFKGTWVKQFDPNLTDMADFTTGYGGTVRVPMMQRTDDDAVYGYAETDTFQLLEMPYVSGDGKELSMLVFLPKGDDLTSAFELTEAGSLTVLQQSLASRQVRVYFPKFSIEAKYSLPETLAEMGMPLAFTDAADFSGMDGTGGLYISDVIHQAWADVNEEGTEAAAATGVILNLASAPSGEIPVFRADHPFVFLIQDTGNGNILFIGQVTNPVGG